MSKIVSKMLKPERRMKVSLTTLDKLLDPFNTLRYYLQKPKLPRTLSLVDVFRSVVMF